MKYIETRQIFQKECNIYNSYFHFTGVIPPPPPHTHTYTGVIFEHTNLFCKMTNSLNILISYFSFFESFPLNFGQWI